MPDENKILELKDEELEKVSGGSITDADKDTIQELENATYLNSGSTIYYNGKTYHATSEILENPATHNRVIVYVAYDDSESKLFVRFQ